MPNDFYVKRVTCSKCSYEDLINLPIDKPKWQVLAEIYCHSCNKKGGYL